VQTAERLAAASSEWAPDPTGAGLPGRAVGSAAGSRPSVRMRGMMAHQEVILGSIGQTLTIRQDSYDRDSFMPGILLACKHIAEHPGVVVGLDTYLGI
jgi:4-hydroxy-tetrahydrodipicolinate reductase